MIEFIFCISTGRAGSLYLTKVLGALPGCIALHEPEPQLNGRFMRRTLSNAPFSQPMVEEMQRKHAAMLEAKGDHAVYAETSHIFIKSFGWYVTEFIAPERVGVVILERNKEAIVESLHRVNCLPTNWLGQKWICTPVNCRPFVPFPERFARTKCRVHSVARRLGIFSSSAQQFERNMLRWYVDEIRERTRRFLTRFPGIKTFRTSAEQLNSQAEIFRLADAFGLIRPDPRDLENIMGRPVNRKRWNDHRDASSAEAGDEIRA